MTEYKVLSMDGGGIKGVFTASFLATCEEHLGASVADYFDLIVGTSTGGIVALGLGAGHSAKEILSFYEGLGPTVFKRAPLWKRGLWLVRPRYDQAPLREALTTKFGGTRLGESRKRLVIPSLNLETGHVYIYKTAHHGRFITDYKVSMVEVALATSAAPVYFPTHRSYAGIPLVDGGLWANNPAGLAAVEAIGILEWPKGQVKMLSIGGPSPSFDAGRLRWAAAGLGQWAPKAVDAIMAAQSSASLGTAKLLLGPDNFFRISPAVPAGRFRLDSVREILSLKGLGQSMAREALPRLEEAFFRVQASDFVLSSAESRERVITHLRCFWPLLAQPD